jgi:hypothetical protein
MGRRSSKLSSVSDVLGKMKFSQSVKEHLKNHEIWSKWTEIVGPDLARVTSPLDLRGKILHINVVHQAWAQQLHFLSPSILGKIKSLCQSSKVSELQFRVGKVVPIVSTKVDNSITLKKDVKLSERMEMTLRAVDDEALRKSIRKAMVAAKARA